MNGDVCIIVNRLLTTVKSRAEREQKPNLFGLCRVATEEDDSQLCGKCHVLKGRSEEMLYADYIDGKRSYMDITLEIRSNR